MRQEEKWFLHYADYAEHQTINYAFPKYIKELIGRIGIAKETWDLSEYCEKVHSLYRLGYNSKQVSDYMKAEYGVGKSGALSGTKRVTAHIPQYQYNDLVKFAKGRPVADVIKEAVMMYIETAEAMEATKQQMLELIESTAE